MKPNIVDLRKYKENIYAEEDTVLFDEAVKAGKSGALRSAYIMIWLACAESLKKRFRFASTRDSAAGRIVGEINRRESNETAIDKYVLDQSRDYGLITQTGHKVLSHIYEKRCLYAHPYEQEPSPEQVTGAASEALEHVLSQPVQLGQGFAETVIRKLIDDPAFLADNEETVSRYAKEVLPRLAERVVPRMLDKYWSELEGLASDPSMELLVRRGRWYSQYVLREHGVDAFDEHEWHEKARKYPMVISEVFCAPDLFYQLGYFPSDYIVNASLDFAEQDGRYLKRIESLHLAGVLSNEQDAAFQSQVADASISNLMSAQLRVRTCFRRLISMFQTHNWYQQNPAMDLVVGNGPEALDDLTDAQLREIGRNILQSAEGRARSSIAFLQRPNEGALWPAELLRGVTLECFVNEDRNIRFKDRYLACVGEILGQLGGDEATSIVESVAEGIADGHFDELITHEEVGDVKAIIDRYPVMAEIERAIDDKVAELF